MAYSDGLAALSRSETVLVYLDFGSITRYITMGNTPSNFTSNFYGCVENINWIPNRAAADGGLGSFGEVVVTARDFPDDQSGNSQGTFFGKMLANVPYYLNRTLDIYVGFYELGDTFNLSNFDKRTYFIKRIDGPDQNGIVKFYASDVISRMKEAEIPLATNGNLNASLTDSATGSTNIVDNTGFSASGGYAIIDDEIVSYSGITGGDSITISTRGQGGTTATAHNADAPVRNIYQATGNVVDEIRTIIEDFTDIDHATYLPDTDWNTQRDSFLSSESVEIWITEPTEVSEIVDQLCKETYVNVWWDDSAQEIKLQALGPSLASITTWNDEEHILDAAITIKRDHKKVLSGVWYFYGKLNKAEGKSAENLESVYINENTVIETNLGERRIKKIYSEFVPSSGTGTATKISGRLIDQYEQPIEFTCHVDAKDSTINVGDAVQIESYLIQHTDGSTLPTIMRVIEKSKRQNNRYYYKLVKTGQETGSRYAVIGPNTLNDYTSESTYNQDNYGFISNNTPEMSNNDDPYLIL